MLIIILCVSFCSDIWYCNMLAYYLGNILVYYLDKTTLLYKYILLYTFLLCCHGYIIMFCRVGSCNSGKIVRLSCENPGKLNLYYLS